MSNIVERLRAYAKSDHEKGCMGRCYSCDCGYDAQRDPLLIQAADEIKRLRAALEQITKASWYGKHSMIEIARRALEIGN